MKKNWSFFQKIIVITVKNPKKLKSLKNNFAQAGIHNIEFYRYPKVGEINASKDESLYEIMTLCGCGKVCQDISKHYFDIIKEAYDNKYKNILIFEDDAKFDLPFNKKNLKKIIHWLSKNYWETFSFGSINYPSIINIPCQKNIAWSKCPLQIHSMAYSKNGIKKLYKSMWTHKMHVDYFFTKVLNHQYVAYPSICFQDKEPGMSKAFKNKLSLNYDFDTLNRIFDHISYWFLPLTLICILIIVLKKI